MELGENLKQSCCRDAELPLTELSGPLTFCWEGEGLL